MILPLNWPPISVPSPARTVFHLNGYKSTRFPLEAFPMRSPTRGRFCRRALLAPVGGTAQTATGTNLYNAPQTVDNSGLLRSIYTPVSDPAPTRASSSATRVRSQFQSATIKGYEAVRGLRHRTVREGSRAVLQPVGVCDVRGSFAGRRQEPPSQALSDAEFAKKGSAIVVSYSRDQYYPVSGPDLSAFRTQRKPNQ